MLLTDFGCTSNQSGRFPHLDDDDGDHNDVDDNDDNGDDNDSIGGNIEEEHKNFSC